MSPQNHENGPNLSTATLGLGLAHSICRFVAGKSTEDFRKRSINTVPMAKWLKEEAERMGLKKETSFCSIWEAAKMNPEELEDIAPEIEDDLIRVIYGSNAIELAGTSLNVTVFLCRSIFNNEEIGEILPRDVEYEAGLRRHPIEKLDEVDADCLELKSRREVVQHAQALMHMISELVFEGQDLTEELICNTHRILYDGLERPGEDETAGAYRIHPCAARLDDKRKTIFIRPSAIPGAMKALVDRYREVVRRAEQLGSIDPYELAGRVAHKFVNIHPFPDGNGRMKRIILNAILLKFAGHVAPFGGEPGARDEYLEIAHRAGKKYHREEGEVDEEKWVGHHELVRHIVKHSMGKVRKMVTSSVR